MSVTLFQWVTEKNPAYGKFGGTHKCYVADMHIGTVRVVQAELLSPASVTAIMHKKVDAVVLCEDPADRIGQGKAWIQAEFMEWFLAVNRLAHAFLQDKQESG